MAAETERFPGPRDRELQRQAERTWQMAEELVEWAGKHVPDAAGRRFRSQAGRGIHPLPLAAAGLATPPLVQGPRGRRGLRPFADRQEPVYGTSPPTRRDPRQPAWERTTSCRGTPTSASFPSTATLTPSAAARKRRPWSPASRPRNASTRRPCPNTRSGLRPDAGRMAAGAGPRLPLRVQADGGDLERRTSCGSCSPRSPSPAAPTPAWTATGGWT